MECLKCSLLQGIHIWVVTTLIRLESFSHICLSIFVCLMLECMWMKRREKLIWVCLVD